VALEHALVDASLRNAVPAPRPRAAPDDAHALEGAVDETLAEDSDPGRRRHGDDRDVQRGRYMGAPSLARHGRDLNGAGVACQSLSGVWTGTLCVLAAAFVTALSGTRPAPCN
jgi:hypothetical protein